MRKININLASHPLRNRRLYYFLVGLAGLFSLVFIILSVVFFLRFTIKGRAIKSALAKINNSISTAETEERRFANRIREAVKKDGDKVDLVNSIILKKSFSWTEFLSKLEECLPDSSYIISLAPTLVEDSRVQFQFKVISKSVDDLLALVNGLLAQKFTEPRIVTMDRNEKGLASEISVSYERSL